MYCHQCGRKNSTEDNYCKQCGTLLKKHVKGKKRHDRSVKPAINNSTIFLIGLIVVLGAFFVAYIATQDQQVQSSSSPVFSAMVMDIASKFYCPCGSCTDGSLEICGCKNPRGGIAKMREIEREVAQGKPSIQVIKEFQQKYGSIKPEYANLIDPK